MQQKFYTEEAGFLIFLTSLILSPACISYCQSSNMHIPFVEVDALLEFKVKHMSKASQLVVQSWNRGNTSSICQTWVGVVCTHSGDHIRDINLTRLGLEGTLAPDLGNFSFLHTLDLSGNAFTGGIPMEIKSCTTLQMLNLYDNNLSGSIPSSLSSLSALRFLLLHNNSLSGHIPPGIFTNCTSLLILSLTSNKLTGPIPELNLPNIQELWLNGNNLEGPIPVSLSNSTDLTILHVTNNWLTGPIPYELGLLSQVRYLKLSANNLTGSIPPSLGNCSQLIWLQLGYNYNLSGPIPFELGLLKNLRVLRLSFSRLIGTIARSLGNCTKIEDLELKADQLNGVIPRELGRLEHVKYADLSQNNLTGEIPSTLGNCTNLMAFSVESNKLSGNIPAELAKLGQLEDLFLSRNQLVGNLQILDLSNLTNLQVLKLRVNRFSGSIPMELGHLKLLQGIDLSDNQFTGEIPWGALSNCTPLSLVDFSYNRLSGGITSYLGKIQRLQYLYLIDNMLGGAIPESADFENLSLLEVDLSFNHFHGFLPSSLSHAMTTVAGLLVFSYNNFHGSLPDWLGRLVMAQGIDMSHNNFSGGIPESLGDCLGLRSLDLSRNHLSGGFPLLPLDLEVLDLSYNNLSGVLPSFLGTRLHRLRLLNVSFNNFSGPIPTEGVFRHLDGSSFQGNPGICGPIIRKKCSVLQNPKQQGRHAFMHQLRSWKGILVTAILSAVFIGLMIILTVFRCCLVPHTSADQPLIQPRLAGTKHFSAQELAEATQGYSEVNLLGEGGTAMVYKGTLSDGKVVVVKKLKDVGNASQGVLLREMHILGKLRHRNLVQVLGCVLNLDVKAVVLEYMANGSLRHYLDAHQQHYNQTKSMESGVLMSYWGMLTRVGKGVAQALVYLHHEYGVPIIHGDVKPSNILLDSDLQPHLGDFGLAKLNERYAGEPGVSVSSKIGGSSGYMAPEYGYATRFTTKVDVYGYGVVLLEMLTGRKPTEVFPIGLTLHGWVKSHLFANSNTEDLVKLVLHSLLQRSFDMGTPIDRSCPYSQTFVQLLQLGVACTEDHPDKRPTIQEVLGFFSRVTSINMQPTEINISNLLG